MVALSGSTLLHEVSKRILGRYLETTGAVGVTVARALRDEAAGIDLQYQNGATTVRVKVKADPYYGIDPHKTADRSLVFYRNDTRSYALEWVADTLTREPGWIQSSQSDELFYYRLVIGQTEAEIAALLDAPDEEFFSQLAVERDDLRIVPFRALRLWFESAHERYTPRPVITDGRASWYRIIPEGDLDAGIVGIKAVGGVFHRVARR